VPPHNLALVHIRRMEGDDLDVVLSAGHLFDDDPTPESTRRFLERDGHHLLFAVVDGCPAGFISGVEITHPDKGTEMLLYELGVDEQHRRRGIGRSLVRALGDLASERGCHGMWVPIEDGDEPALATYLASGAESTEKATIAWWPLTSR
jgi:ribosomal protein S18 acetylase RimI-like enzyme